MTKDKVRSTEEAFSTLRALKLALEALETLHDENMDYLVRNKLSGENNQCMVFARDVIKSIKRTLAQPEQEPVAWMSEHRFDELRQGFTVMTTLTKQRAFEDDVALYTTPPQRTWVGLTPQERDEINKKVYGAVPHHVAFHAAIEAKLKEKNT
jgi:hypothetical protein